jgi:hypothetical protein
MRTLMVSEQEAVAGGMIGAGPGDYLLAAGDVGTAWQSELETGGCNANGHCFIVPNPPDPFTITGAFTNVGTDVQVFDDGTSITTIIPVVPWPATYNGACGVSPTDYTNGVCSGWVSSWII